MGLRFAICCLALGAMLLGSAGPAQAQDVNDDFVDAVPLVVGQIDNDHDNTDATTQAGEALTPTGIGGDQQCAYSDGSTSQANYTLWWTLVGTGQNMRVDTVDSSLDTHLGIFGGTLGSWLYCSNGSPYEALEFPSNAGQVYHVQVGGCWDDSVFGCDVDQGAISLFAASAASNDNRAAAAVLPTGQLVHGNNFVATVEPSERVYCVSDLGVSPFGRTVWYRWTAPGAGTATFTAAGGSFDAVLAVYPPGSSGPLRCDDDPNASGPSRITMAVTAGELFLQVGGATYPSGPDEGSFDVSADFTPNPDRDADGAANAQDCQPDNPAVHPGATDVPLNGIDEDCNGVDAQPPVNPDRDADGATNAQDCQPDNPAVHPGARDIPQNGIDEDCARGDAPYPKLASTFVLSLSRFGRASWKVRSLKVHDLPSAASVELRFLKCHGVGCPAPSRVFRQVKASGEVATARIRKAVLHARDVLEIRVMRPGWIGVVRRYLFKRQPLAPKPQDLCLPPGKTTPKAC